MQVERRRVAFVSGGTRGIGRGIVNALAGAGLDVAFTYNAARELAQKVVEDLRGQGVRAVPIQMDLEHAGGIHQALAAAKDALGPIEVLINNAAIAQEKPFEHITAADWDRMLAINLRGPFLACQEVLPDMLQAKWGRIVNITSIGGQWGGFNQVHYAAAKAGLINLTRSLARIYSPMGVTANAVAPGLVGTKMSSRELESEAGREKVRNIPMARVATVEEIADVVVFLVSEQASYITGQTVNVNGGMYFG